MNWSQAETRAGIWGGHLVTINDREEELWLRNQFGANEYFWIGFNDINTEGHWEWVSGEPVTYTNWWQGEPNNESAEGEPEDAAIMNWGGGTWGTYYYGDGWNDNPMDNSYRGVIETAEMPTILVPTSQLIFTYDPIVFPVVSTNPAQAKPVAVGSVATGDDTLSLQISLGQFTGFVDIYFALYAPAIDPNNIYILNSDNDFQTTIVPWKKNTQGPIDEYLFGDIPISLLTPGTYYLYLAVTPAFSLDSYYLWETYFIIPSSPAHYTLSVSTEGNGNVTSSDGKIQCGSDCSESYLSGTAVTLTAKPASGWSFSGWSGACSGTGTCIVTMTSDKSVTATFSQQPSPQCPNIAGSWDGTSTAFGDVLPVTLILSQDSCNVSGIIKSPEACPTHCDLFDSISINGSISGNKFSFTVPKSPQVDDCDSCKVICYGTDYGTLTVDGGSMYGSCKGQDCESGGYDDFTLNLTLSSSTLSIKPLEMRNDIKKSSILSPKSYGK